MAEWDHDGLTFHYREAGAGIPFFFQHGLGGDVEQPFGLFKPPQGFRLIAFDCRAHGKTRPVGDHEKIGIASFADDLRALMDHLEIRQAIVGGISMGAAVSLNFTLRDPQRVRGLVQSRAAWLGEPNGANAKLFGRIAGWIRRYGAAAGLDQYYRSELYRQMLEESPDVARSLAGQFESPRAAETVVKLERIPHDTPCQGLDELSTIAVPTLVLANRHDPVHPYLFGTKLAETIAGAEFVEVTAKSVSEVQHGEDVQKYLAEFLQRHFQ